jgi:hypothetical protein
LKTARSIEQAHVAQLLNYLKATPSEVGLVLNFGPRPEFKRVAFGNVRKSVGPHEPPSDFSYLRHPRDLRLTAPTDDQLWLI